MRSWLKRHKALFGYATLVFVAVGAVQLHHLNVTAEQNKRDERSCAQRTLLADNQVFVLRTLDSVLISIQHSAPAPIRTRFLEDRRELIDRLADFNPRVVC